MTVPRVAAGDSDFPIPPAQFRPAQRSGWTVLEVEGDLEDEDKDAFHEAVFGSINSGENGGDIALDLSGVTFLSEGALAVLVHALKFQHARGKAVRLIRPSSFVQKKLERTALNAFFPTELREA